MAFREISVEELRENPFTLINKDWMLITAGDENRHNAMTASWGGVGELWGKYDALSQSAITPCASSGRSTARP